MNEIILKDSKFSRFPENPVSFDLVEYNRQHYIGINLYKNFANYLANNYHCSVMKFNDIFEAEKYFNNINY